MKYLQYSIFISAIFVVGSLPIVLGAQEFSPLGKLAQDYLIRMTDDSQDIKTNLQNTTVVNKEMITREALTESIDTVTRTVNEINEEKEILIDEVKRSVKTDIDQSIAEIRKTSEIPAFQLQRSIDPERLELFENVTRTIEEIKPTEIQKIQQLKSEVNTSLESIRTNLQTESKTPVQFENAEQKIRESFSRFELTFAQKKEVIQSRDGILMFEDSDGDGISDYDEMYIYMTDPGNPRTTAGDMTDGEKVRQGINPLSERSERMQYQDPREDRESFVTSSYTVERVELIQSSSESAKKIRLEGLAIPNSFVTLFVYSTPIIVTVKTAESGAWSYELEEELEDGEHQIFVATVDNSGKIVARSNPILFTKSAEAASIGIIGDLNTSANSQGFLKENFILITLALLIGVVIVAMMLTGNHSSVRSVVVELRSELDKK